MIIQGGREIEEPRFRSKELLEVEWEDAGGGSRWVDEKEIKPNEHVCITRTVGWKINSNRKYLTVASTRSSSGDCCDRTTIPRSYIKSIRRIK